MRLIPRNAKKLLAFINIDCFHILLSIVVELKKKQLEYYICMVYNVSQFLKTV